MPAEVKALVFDVFGTVVDWRGSIIRAIAAAGVPGDPARLADEWYAGYRPALDAVRSGAQPWAKLDILHRRNLDALLARHGARARRGAAADPRARAGSGSIPGPMRSRGSRG